MTKTYLSALLALLPSASVIQAPSSDTAMLSGALGSTADRGTDFVRGGVNVFDYLSERQRADVRFCRRATDATAGLQAAVRAAALGPSKRVILPDGCYRTTAMIVLSSGIELVGASMRATKVMPVGNFPALSAAGTYAHGLTGVGVENMSIICAGKDNPDAMGVKLVYVNRGKLRNIYFNGCHHALDLYDQWQTSIDNITADGQGAEQNQVGVYMGGPTDPANTAPNNAVILSNSTMQNVAEYGYQLVFFAGSKFVNDEAMNGVTGWQLCGEPYKLPDQACQFGHFDNIVADTTSGPGIIVNQNNNRNAVNNIMFDHVWIGSSTNYGLYLAGVTYSQFDNIHVTRADNGIYLHNSNNVKISANVSSYNRNNNVSFAAVISGGSDNSVWATNTQSDHPTGYNGIAEIDASHGNSIWGGLAACSLGLSFGTGPGPEYAKRSCRYEVQGRQVHITFRLDLSALGRSSGAAMLAALPFAADTAAQPQGAAGVFLLNDMAHLPGAVAAEVVPSSNVALLFSQTPSGPVALTEKDFLAYTTISGSLTYIKK